MYRQKNKAAIYAKQREWAEKNKEKTIAGARRYRERNKEICLARTREWKKRQLKENPVYQLRESIRHGIKQALKRGGFRKSGRLSVALGCSWDEFKTHIEKQFLPGMTWENRADWHIDHITPVSTAKTEAEVLQLNHFTNLRPLWGRDNILKRNKITHLI